MKTFLGLLMAAALIAPSALVFPSQAAVRAVSPASDRTPASRIAEGCGPGFERGFEGRCRPIARGRWEDRREEGRREEHWRENRWRERERVSVGCPRGYHYRERDGRCWQN